MDGKWRTSAWQAGAWRGWLTDHGSLTHRLRRRCPGFNVRRLAQRPARPGRDECASLGLRPGRLALIREVLLLDAATPLVFAHSVIPLCGLTGPWSGLAGLGNRPLGATLFGNPRIRRHPLACQRLDARHPLYRAAARHLARPPATLWARRSRFTLAGHPILVTEVFLPAVLELDAPLPPHAAPAQS